ncbi:MAG: peptidoglycan-binding protein [Desulfobulbaceae bacterium]|nr:MAG: peptidoglycan-binding protein [Desulfobulbaceae bacterium]
MARHPWELPLYVDYFGLKAHPFSIAPDPRYLYMSARHREALAHLLYGLKNDGGFVLLTGEVGTGKTTICRQLIAQVPDHIDLAVILNPKVNVSELLETICDELGIAVAADAGIKSLVDSLNTRLLATNAQGRKTVLVIDEAQNLAPDVLEQLRLLTNLETDQRKLLQIILLGQPELRDMINGPRLRQLAQRLTARYHLGPLDGKEVAAYIEHRLQVAGCERLLFPPAMVRRIHRLSKGVPRLINLLCDRALLGAYSMRKDRIDGAIIRQAYREIFDLPARNGRFPLLAAIMAGVLMIIGLSAWLFLPLNRTGITAQPSAVLTNAAPVEEPQTTGQEPATAWPADFAFGTSPQDAFADLAALWGLDYLPELDVPCRFASNAGLRCLERQDSLETLRGYNRPAVLTLYDDDGAPFYVVLAGLTENRARFISGNQERHMDIRAIESRWFGEYRLLWRNGGQFDQVLLPGGQGRNVVWLSAVLTELGLYRQTGTESRLDGTLLAALKRFQFSAGLTPDGALGPQTIIHLQRASDSPGPRLYRSGVQ